MVVSGGSNRSTNAQINLVTVRTEFLRERLNRLYDTLRSRGQNYSLAGRFDYLWDLKELALLEGKGSVQIPDAWLDELEKIFVETSDINGRGH